MKNKVQVVPSGIVTAAVSLLKPYFPALTEEELPGIIANGITSEREETWAKPLTRKQAADRLNISIRSLDYLVADGKLNACKIGKSVRIDPASVSALLAYRPLKGVTA